MVIKQIIETALQIFASSNTLSKFKEARDGPAGKHLATRVGQHNNTKSATERMTDTTMRTRARDRAQPWLHTQPYKIFGQIVDLLEN